MAFECDMVLPQFVSVPLAMELRDDIVLLDIVLDDAIELPDMVFFVQLWFAVIALCVLLIVLCAIDPPDMALPLDMELPCARAWPAMNMETAAATNRIRDIEFSGQNCACRGYEGRIRVGTEGTQARVHP